MVRLSIKNYSLTICICISPTEASAYDVLKLLFFALFGLTKAEDTLVTRKREGWVVEWATIIFSVYLLITAIVLINLLIAMMSDTYQRIQVKFNFLFFLLLNKKSSCVCRFSVNIRMYICILVQNIFCRKNLTLSGRKEELL